jgi:hypothetical protein
MTSVTEKLEKTLSFNAFTVALVVASRSRTNHTNFENASTQTKMTAFCLAAGKLAHKINEKHLQGPLGHVRI